MIFASACWCCHQCILSAQILTTLMAVGIDSAMHLRSFSASLLPWDIPAVAPLWQSLSDRFITHPGVQDHLRMFELLELLQASNSLHFKLVVYMKIQLESRRLQEQANTGTSVLSFQWGNFISNGKGGRILKPKEALVKLICNRSH